MHIDTGFIMGCLTGLLLLLLIGTVGVTYEKITGDDLATDIQDQVNPPSDEELRRRERRKEKLEEHEERINNPQARAQDARDIINTLNQRMYQAEHTQRVSDGESIVLSKEYAHSFYMMFPLITETDTFQSITWKGYITYKRELFDNSMQKKISFSQHGGRCVYFPTLSSTIGSQAPLEVSFSITESPLNSPPPLIASSCPYNQNYEHIRSTLDEWYNTFH